MKNTIQRVRNLPMVVWYAVAAAIVLLTCAFCWVLLSAKDVSVSTNGVHVTVAEAESATSADVLVAHEPTVHAAPTATSSRRLYVEQGQVQTIKASNHAIPTSVKP